MDFVTLFRSQSLLLAATSLAAILSGCNNYGPVVAYEPCAWESDPNALIYKKRKSISLQEVASKLVSNLFDGKCYKNLAVFDLTPLKDFDEHNSLFSYTLSTLIKNEIVKCCHIPVVEINMRKEIRVNPLAGSSLLSRVVNRLALAKGVDIDYAVVGYYSASSERVYIVLQLIDIEEKEVIRSTSLEIPMTCEVYELLHF